MAVFCYHLVSLNEALSALASHGCRDTESDCEKEPATSQTDPYCDGRNSQSLGIGVENRDNLMSPAAWHRRHAHRHGPRVNIFGAQMIYWPWNIVGAEGKMTASMTSYEQLAWEKLITDERSRRGSWRARGVDKVSGAVSAAGNAVKRIPGAERVTEALDDSIRVALNGAAKAVFMPSISSVSIERRIKWLRKRHPEVGDASPFEVLDLRAWTRADQSNCFPS